MSLHKESKKLLLTCSVTIVLILCLNWFRASQAFAKNTEWSIVCQKTGLCDSTISSSLPLFSETNVLPGNQFVRDITIHNQQQKEACSVYVGSVNQTEDQASLSDQLDMVMVRNQRQLFAALSLEQLSTPHSQFVETIPPQTSAQYQIQITFNPQASNTYQGKTSVFDVNLTFSCAVLPTVTPSPTKRPTPTATPVISSVTITPDPCSAPPPLSAPRLKVENLNQDNGTVSFSWTEVPEVTEYWLELDDTSGMWQSRYRGITVPETQISYLTFSQPISFRVIPLHSCAKGPASNVIVVDKKPYFLLNKLAQTQEQMADVATPSSLAPPEVDPNGSVLGTAVEISELNHQVADDRQIEWFAVATMLGLSLALIWRLWIFLKQKKRSNSQK